jgi:drug/metabolite transporter (DMT)-like permease
MSWRTVTAFAAVGILWGSTWILSPLLPGPELSAGAVRFAIAAALLGAASFVAGRLRTRAAGAVPLVPSLVLGVTMVSLPYAAAVWAKDSVSAGLAAVVYALMPLAALFFSKRVDSASIPMMAIGIGGVTFAVAQGISYSVGQIGGAIVLIFAVLLGAFSLNYAKDRITKDSLLLSSAIQSAAAAVLLIILGGISGQLHPSAWNMQSLLALTLLSVADGAIALPVLYWLLLRMDAWQAASLQWLATLIAVAEAAWFLRAKPTLEMDVGVVMTGAALFWMFRRGGEPESESSMVSLASRNVRFW